MAKVEREITRQDKLYGTAQIVAECCWNSIKVKCQEV